MIQEPDFAAAVEASPYPYLFMAPDLTILGANAIYLHLSGRTPEELVGRNVFDAFPPDPDNPEGERQFRDSFARVLATRRSDTLALVRYAISDPESGGALVEHYWSIVHTPLLDARGKVSCLMQTPLDVTELYLLKKAMLPPETARDLPLPTEGGVLVRSQALEQANRMLDAELSRLRNLFAQAPGFMAVVRGPQYEFELANEAYCRLVGRHDLIGKPLREAVPEAYTQVYIDILDRVFATGQAFVGRDMKAMLHRQPAGPPDEVYIDFVIQPLMADDGAVAGLFMQGYDITAQKRAQDELRISNERLNLAIEGSGDGIWDWDLRIGKVLYSKRGKKMLGYAEDEIGDSIEEWGGRLHPDDRENALMLLQDCIEGRTQTYVNEHRLRCKDGSWKWVLVRALAVARDERGRALHMTGMMSDISNKKESDELILRHANFDLLTGLPNRRLFRDRLDHEVRKAHRTGLRTALLFIDLDRFKEVNDLFGHDAGDQLLVQVAQRLSACVRDSDTVARLGGDEFTVILSELYGVAHVEYIAQKILAVLAEPFRLGNEVAYVSGSIGITLHPADGEEPEALMRNADQAMYVAKSAGRNQFCYFTRSMQKQAHMRLRLVADLRHALRDGQLQVHYQPVVDLRSGAIVKAEALLRWNHPTMGRIEPVQLIALAEESGMINEIGEWVFHQAASCAQRWTKRRGTPFQIGVNRSPVQFMTKTHEDDWGQYLQSLGLPGSSIAVEITESVLLNASAAVSEKLLAYRDAGIQVAIDDFGTGYSSLAYLKKFDIDYLKIAPSFVHDMATSDSDRAVAESIIVMAHQLGLKVIAEGIETEQQRDLLCAAGCDYGQGFWYARAAPAEEFEQMLMRNSTAGSSLLH
jgi:diguanylate cyclase (GGDEF)-like protein/PAS domain S-box-containing protein